MFKTRKVYWWIAMLLMTISILAVGCSHKQPAQTPAPPVSPTLSAAPTTLITAATNTESDTPSPTVSETPLDNQTWTPTPTSTEIPTPTPTDAVAPTPSDTPSVTPTPTDTVTPTPSDTPSPTPTPTPTPTTSPTPTPSGGGGGGGGGGGTPPPPPIPTPTLQPGTLSIGAPATVKAGGTFTVNVNIGQIADFSAYDFSLTFNSSIIRLVPGTEGGAAIASGMISSTVIPVDIWEYYPAGTPGGTVMVLGHIPNNGSANGSGYLTQLHFTVVGTQGQISTLVLAKATSNEYYCYNSKGDQIPVSSQNGSVTVTP